MTTNIIRLMRLARHFGLVALSPVDYISRALTGKTDLPPLHLRRYVGPWRSFESSGAEFMNYLRTLTDLRPDQQMLDIGCGCGQMALQLKDYLTKEGAYVGVDIHGPSVRWCQKKMETRWPNFKFAHIDVRNATYNPNGINAAETFRMPYEDCSFDLILLKSVFTHMRPPEVSNYVREVARLLKLNGRCVATFFLLNEEQAILAQNGANSLSFSHGEGAWRYRYKNSPESAVAYEEDFVMRLLEKYSLTVKQRIYGKWSGRQEGLSYQDILLIEK